MKKLLSIVAVAVMFAASCTKLGIPTVEFTNIIGSIYAGTEYTPVALKLNIASEEVVTATVRASYIGTDLQEFFSIEGDVHFDPYAKETIFNLSNQPTGEKEISTIKLTITGVPEGYLIGAKFICVLTPSTQEAVVYSFEQESANLLESVNVGVELIGSVSGKEYKAAADYTIPVSVEGDGAQYIDGAVIKVAAGESTGYLTFKVKGNANDTFAPVRIKVDASAGGFIAGDVSELLCTVVGTPTAKTLATTWTFKEIVDGEELEFWYEEMEDDYKSCPVNNDGFTLSIVEKDGALQLTPGTGDFANYYTSCTMTPCAPKNPVANSVTLGAYTAKQGNMFVAEVYEPYQESIFYELSKANRSFDNTSATFGKGYISISFISRDEIIVTIHDYDEPRFALLWYDKDKFDPEMVGFASVFTRTPGK